MPTRLLARSVPFALGLAITGCITLTKTLEVDVQMPARQVSKSIDSIAVLDFGSNRRGWGGGASQSVRGGLTREGYIRVVDRSSRYVLIGSVNVGRAQTSSDHSSRKVKYKEDGNERTKTVHTYTFRKQLTSTLSYELREGAQTIAANTFSLHYDQTWARDSARAARDAAPSDYDIISTQIAMMANAVVFDISPHTEKRKLEFEMGSHPGFRQGMTYLENGRQDQAMLLWQQVADQSTEPKQRASALYNIAVILEIQKDYAGAFNLFSEVDHLVPGNERYIQAMTRVEKAKLEQEALARQTGR